MLQDLAEIKVMEKSKRSEVDGQSAFDENELKKQLDRDALRSGIDINE